PPSWTGVVAVAPDARPRTVAVTPVGAVPGSRVTYTMVSSPTTPAARTEVVSREAAGAAGETRGFDTSMPEGGITTSVGDSLPHRARTASRPITAACLRSSDAARARSM